MKEERSVILVGDLAERAVTLPERARKITVLDQASLVKANEFIGICKTLMDEVAATFDPHIKKALELKRSLEAEKDKYWVPPNIARSLVRTEISRYALEQSEILRKAELAKQEAERKARIALESGRVKTSEKILAKVEPLPPAPKAAGLSFRDDWKFEILDDTKLSRKFLMADQGAVGVHVRTYKENCVDEMAKQGVRVFMVKTPIQR